MVETEQKSQNSKAKRDIQKDDDDDDLELEFFPSDDVHINV